MRLAVTFVVAAFTAFFVAYHLMASGSEARAHQSTKRTGRPLRVMTFNIWKSGTRVENGIAKIAKHILLNDPDVVGLQVRFDLADLQTRGSFRKSARVH